MSVTQNIFQNPLFVVSIHDDSEFVGVWIAIGEFKYNTVKLDINKFT